MSLYFIAISSMRMSVTAWEAFQRDILPSIGSYGAVLGEAFQTVLGVLLMVLIPYALPPSASSKKASRERSSSIASNVTSVSINSNEMPPSPASTAASVMVSHECISCDDCGKSNPQIQCTRCQLVYYCSMDCKWKHREAHKSLCNEGKLARERQNTKKNTQNIHSDAKSIETMEASNIECSICLSAEVAYAVVLKNCHHQFCYPCIRDWQHKQQKTSKGPTTCRLCRSPSENVQTNVISNARALETQAQKLEGTLLIAAVTNQKDSMEETTTMQLRQKAIRELDMVLDGLPEMEAPVRALLIKTEVLIHMNRIHDALECFDRLLHVSKGGAKRDLPKAVGPQLKLLGHKLRANHYIWEAQELQSQEKWTKALPLYQNVVDHLDDIFVTVTAKRRLIAYSGLATCAYNLRMYDLAIEAGKQAIALNRHSPNVHINVALSYKAQGNISQAVNVMNQAVLHEAPWDKAHRLSVMELYEELLSELQEVGNAELHTGEPKQIRR